MNLILSNKNKAFDFIADSGLSPQEFAIKDNSDSYYSGFAPVTIIKHKQSKYFFSFETGDEDIRYRCSPAENKESEGRIVESWGSLWVHFRQWLGYVKRELEQPNKWEQAFNESKFFESGFDESNNNKFSYEDVKQIEASLEQIKLELKGNKDIDAAGIQAINSKLDYLLDRSKILGRVDWKNLAVGTFMGLATNLSANYSKETAQAFLVIVKVCFKALSLLN